MRLGKENIAENSHNSTDSNSTILVVEDNLFNQTLIAKQLELLGHTCTLASHGQAGFEQWQSGYHKIILTDCEMPVWDGYQMTTQIRQSEKDKHLSAIPIIAVKGTSSDMDDERCLSVGMNAVLIKPFPLDKLKKILEKWYENG
ncbi:MAG: CheY-like chemotaxis protein [Cocleimonas sp.]|jgi:CheY-like chemotaxis protein